MVRHGPNPSFAEGALRHIVTGHARYSEAVERNVPGELFPACSLEVFGDLARDARVTKHRSDIMRSRLGPALVFSQDNLSVRQMLDHARLDSVQTNVANSAQDFLCAERLGESRFVAEPVLQGEDRRR